MLHMASCKNISATVIQTVVTIFLTWLCLACESARILGVFPMPFRAHQVVFREYTQELARRGHEVVVITPMPVFPNGKGPNNITEIDTKFEFESFYKTLEIKFQRGIVCDPETMLEVFFKSYKFQQATAEWIYRTDIKELIKNSKRFDLVVTETYVDTMLLFSKIFDAPIIQFSSLHIHIENFEVVGAPARHPVYHPNWYRNRFINLSFFETLYEIKIEYDFMRSNYNSDVYHNTFIKNYYGKSSPTIYELRKNVSLFFGNSHKIFDNNRAVPLNLIYLGALHLRTVDKLPQDLKLFLDKSTRGIVYVSFGTNVFLSEMENDLLSTLLDAFSMLPYDVILKSDIDDLIVSENVRIGSWFPQRDLLMHPNIKAFVTQGGLQSADEAVDAAVPLVGMPIWADQSFNVNKFIELGIGVYLDPLKVTKEDVVRAIHKVIEDESYRQNIRRLKTLLQDQPQSPLERAVWWTEYVLRHGGARHLRSPAANMSWSEYYETDILVSITLCFVFLIWFCTHCQSLFKKAYKIFR